LNLEFQVVRTRRKVASSVKAIALSLSLAIALILSSAAMTSKPTEILWDTWSVPHIFARNSPELFQALGWAQMQSHGDLILRLYGQARGKAAEYWGEDYLDSDRQVLTMGVRERADQWYDRQTPEIRNYLNAFVAGMNAYAKEHSDRLSDEVKIVLPVTPTDVLAHIQRVVHFTFLIGSNVSVSPALQRWQGGSNAWAIAPSRSASGNTLLLMNPHLPWSDRFLFYEVQLKSPDIDAYGCTLMGMPMLVMGFNDRLGWTHTVNPHNGWGLYELTLVEGGYRFDGEVRELETEVKTFQVKQPDGTLREEKFPVRRAVQGPIVAQKGDRAIALRVTGLDEAGILAQYWQMIRAKNFDEFEAALKPLQLPFFSVIYGDRDGHIFHLFNGRIPKRPQGDWETWQHPVPGDTSATLWTETHPYADLPRVLDPPSGWLQNANDPPWTTTFPPVLNSDDYPSYFSPRFLHLRGQRSVKLLQESDRLSLESLIAKKFDTRMELADRVLDDLIAAAREGSQLARKAANVLSAWDRQANADSRGAVLFAFWARAMNFDFLPNPALFAQPWDESNPLQTPAGLRDWKAAVTTLETAARQVQEEYGRLDIPWGDVFRLRVGDADLPATGGDGNWGIFSVLQFSPTDNDRFTATFGDTYIAAIEFADPPRARVLLTYGNETQPGSSDRDRQISLYANKTLRPVWRTRSEIESHLKSRQVFD